MYTRIVNKIKVWLGLAEVAQNWFEILWARVLQMLGVKRSSDVVIQLKNGIRVSYGQVVDLSAVPLIVEIWKDQVYTSTEVKIAPHDVVVDIGANVGNFALFAAGCTQEKIYAFEPEPKNFRLLQENIERNKFHEHIVPIQAAVADNDGTMQMNISAVDTAHSLYIKNFKQKESVTVQTLRLESFCKQHDIARIGFLKLDCEGAEYDIILSLTPEMLSKIDKIILEHHDRFTGRDSEQIVKYLESHEFATKRYHDIYIAASKNKT